MFTDNWQCWVSLLNDRMERDREREKGGLKLLYQLMEMYKYFSNLNFNKLISSFFARWLNSTWCCR
jgi:hypothetical protein